MKASARPFVHLPRAPDTPTRAAFSSSVMRDRGVVKRSGTYRFSVH